MSWTPRVTAPAANDPLWIMTSYGGYNACIAGSDGPPSVLPNCTGYVHGRIMEGRGVTTDDSGLSFGNGADYWSGSGSNWTRSQNPQPGAVACYYTNTAANGQPGHVAIVEEVIDNDTIIVTESNYGGVRWERLTCYRQYGWRPSAGWNVSPQGFLLNPYIPPSHGKMDFVTMLYLMKWLKIIKRRKKHDQHYRI